MQTRCRNGVDGTTLKNSTSQKRASSLAAHVPNIDNACYVPTDLNLREIQAYKMDGQLWKILSGRMFAQHAQGPGWNPQLMRSLLLCVLLSRKRRDNNQVHRHGATRSTVKTRNLKKRDFKRESVLVTQPHQGRSFHSVSLGGMRVRQECAWANDRSLGQGGEWQHACSQGKKFG